MVEIGRRKSERTGKLVPVWYQWDGRIHHAYLLNESEKGACIVDTGAEPGLPSLCVTGKPFPLFVREKGGVASRMALVRWKGTQDNESIWGVEYFEAGS